MYYEKKIRNKTKLFGLFVSVLAVGTFAAAMSEHVTSVGANDGTYQAYSDPTEAFISQIGESARQLGQENDLYASVMITSRSWKVDQTVWFGFLSTLQPLGLKGKLC